VQKAPHLFSDTVLENILLGLDPDSAEVAAAVERAVLEPDLAQMAARLETVVGPRGVRLSGGQVQRVAEPAPSYGGPTSCSSTTSPAPSMQTRSD